jgi:hypothetical protein
MVEVNIYYIHITSYSTFICFLYW